MADSYELVLVSSSVDTSEEREAAVAAVIALVKERKAEVVASAAMYAVNIVSDAKKRQDLSLHLDPAWDPERTPTSIHDYQLLSCGELESVSLEFSCRYTPFDFDLCAQGEPDYPSRLKALLFSPVQTGSLIVVTPAKAVRTCFSLFGVEREGEDNNNLPVMSVWTVWPGTTKAVNTFSVETYVKLGEFAKEREEKMEFKLDSIPLVSSMVMEFDPSVPAPSSEMVDSQVISELPTSSQPEIPPEAAVSPSEPTYSQPEIPQLPETSPSLPPFPVIPATHLPQPETSQYPVFPPSLPPFPMIPATHPPQPETPQDPAFPPSQPPIPVMPSFSPPQPVIPEVPTFAPPQPSYPVIPTSSPPQPETPPVPMAFSPQASIPPVPVFSPPQPATPPVLAFHPPQPSSLNKSINPSVPAANYHILPEPSCFPQAVARLDTEIIQICETFNTRLSALLNSKVFPGREIDPVEQMVTTVGQCLKGLDKRLTSTVEGLRMEVEGMEGFMGEQREEIASFVREFEGIAETQSKIEEMLTHVAENVVPAVREMKEKVRKMESRQDEIKKTIQDAIISKQTSDMPLKVASVTKKENGHTFVTITNRKRYPVWGFVSIFQNSQEIACTTSTYSFISLQEFDISAIKQLTPGTYQVGVRHFVDKLQISNLLEFTEWGEGGMAWTKPYNQSLVYKLVGNILDLEADLQTRYGQASVSLLRQLARSWQNESGDRVNEFIQVVMERAPDETATRNCLADRGFQVGE